MKPASFRLRMALLSVALSGLVLAAFGATALILIYRMRLEGIDREIKGRVHPQLSQPQDARHWIDFEHELRFTFGSRELDEIILHVRRPAGEVLFISPEWPADLNVDSFLSVGTPPVPDEDRPTRPASPKGRDSGKRGPKGPGEKRPPKAQPPRMQISPPAFFTRSAGGRPWRIGVIGNQDVTLALGVDLSRFHAEMRQTGAAFLAALPVALLLIAAGGWLIARRSLRPVAVLTQTVERVTAKGLDQRIAAGDAHAEFARLITVFNQMMDRLQNNFEQASRFSADAAHELNTPLTILQGRLESAIQDSASDFPPQQVYGDLLDEVQRLKVIIRKLLLLSLADAGQLKLNMELFNLSEAVEEICEDTRVLAPALNVEKNLAPNLSVIADADLMRQVLQNLASNAVKYTPEDGSIAFDLRQEGPVVKFTISNSGEGIAPVDREKIFSRFYRAEKSRSRKTEGVGLGLSLSREIVRAHKGDLALVDATDNRVAFAMTLPTNL